MHDVDAYLCSTTSASLLVPLSSPAAPPFVASVVRSTKACLRVGVSGGVCIGQLSSSATAAVAITSAVVRSTWCRSRCSCCLRGMLPTLRRAGLFSGGFATHRQATFMVSDGVEILHPCSNLTPTRHHCVLLLPSTLFESDWISLFDVSPEN